MPRPKNADFDWSLKYRTLRQGVFENQRDQSKRVFPSGTLVQVETPPDKYGKVLVRQPYPNDDWFGWFLTRELEKSR